jgi:hypothetical protein
MKPPSLMRGSLQTPEDLLIFLKNVLGKLGNIGHCS